MAWQVQVVPGALGLEALQLEIERVQIEKGNVLLRQNGLIRLSVGLEDIADITADFEIGFRAAARVAAKAAE